MKTVNKIMVAYDGSDHAIQELKYGCSLASSLQSELIIAIVIHRRDVKAVRVVEQKTGSLTVDEYIEGRKTDRTQEMEKTSHEMVPGIGPISIRPLKDEDEALFIALFQSLSSRSVYLRFFTPLKTLPEATLHRLTRIDSNRHIALTALLHVDTEEKMVGVARVILEDNPKQAEFSVLVGDHWQGKGIGANLLQRCIDIAMNRGVETIYGTVLSENTQMLALGRKLGFKMETIPREPAYHLSLTTV